MAMNTRLPFLALGNTTSQLAGLKGQARQVVVDEAKHTLVVMDGAKNGGHPLAKEERRIYSASPAVRLNGAASADLSSDITLDVDVAAALPEEFGELQGAVESAKAAGQIGGPVYVGDADANELTETGFYAVSMNNDTALARHWPARLSDRTPVAVQKSGNMVYQFAGASEFFAARRKVGESWERWRVLTMISAGVSVYVSKDGSDDNLGMWPEAPVLTPGRAVEVADAIAFARPDAAVTFRFGEGDWGNITFRSLPYFFNIYPYDGAKALEYSDALPRFGVLSLYNCACLASSAVIDHIDAQGTRLAIDSGYKKINRVSSNWGSDIQFYSLDNPANTLEIGQSAGSYHVIEIRNCSVLSWNRLTFRLAEDVSAQDFVYADTGSQFCKIYTDTNAFDLNGHVFTGKKFSFQRGTRILTAGSGLDENGVPSGLMSFFGEGYSSESGVMYNGVSTGNVRKTGDAMTGALKVPNVAASATDNTVVYAGWVSQKLGSAASLATLDEAVETLETRKQKAVAQINAEAQAAIYMGFPYELEGREHRVGYSLFDQQNLAARAIVAAQNPGKTIQIPLADEDGKTVWLDVPTETVLDIHKTGVVNHTDVVLKAALEKKERVMAARSEAEIQSIMAE